MWQGRCNLNEYFIRDSYDKPIGNKPRCDGKSNGLNSCMWNPCETKKHSSNKYWIKIPYLFVYMNIYAYLVILKIYVDITITE